MTVAAVVLAAGGGSRYAGPTHKLLAPFRGSTVVAHALDQAMASGMDETIVVLGAVGVELPDGVTLVWNDRWEQGLASSLRVALDHATDAGHEAVVVGLGDQPLVSADSWRRVSGCEASPIGVATYDGERSNPVRLAAAVWDLLPTTGDAAGRSLMQSRPELVTEVPCAGSAADVDTVEDLHRWS